MDVDAVVVALAVRGAREWRPKANGADAAAVPVLGRSGRAHVVVGAAGTHRRLGGILVWLRGASW